MKKLFPLFFFVVLFTTCTEDEITTRDYPRVRTKLVKVKANEGAYFTGEITFKKDPIEDHGFVWGTVEVPTLSNSNSQKISLREKDHAGTFEGSVLQSLETNKAYFVRAYAITSEYTVYGEVLKFVSLGSKAPELLSLKPNLGTWKDSVLLVGKNFSSLTKVFFEDVEAQIFYSKTDTIRAIVPTSLTNKVSTVSVSFDNNVSELQNSYQLKEPTISEITPSSGGVLIDVEIKGEFFHPETNYVTFGSIQAITQTVSTKLIKAKVPAGIAGGVNTVKVQTGDENLTATVVYTNNPPTITGISPNEAWVSEEITISGDHFGSDAYSNKIYFDGMQTYAHYADNHQIKVYVPASVKNINSLIEISYNGQKVSSDQLFTVKPFIVESVSPQSLNFNIPITIEGKYFPASTEIKLNGTKLIPSEGENGIGYYIPQTLLSHINDFEVSWNSYTFNKQLTSKWVQKSNALNDQLYLTSHLTSFNKKAYFAYFSNVSGNYEIWSLDATNNTWNKVSDFLSKEIDLDPTNLLFSVNEEIYLFNYHEGENQFISLNILTQEITIKNTPPFNYGAAYQVNGEIYLIENPGYKTKVWKYNASNDTWDNTFTNNNYPYYIGDGDVVGDVIYYFEYGILYGFNTKTNSFNSYEIPFAYTTFSPVLFSFSIGNFIYYGLDNREFWKFDAVNKTWTEEGKYMHSYDSYFLGITLDNRGYLIESPTGLYSEYDPSF